MAALYIILGIIALIIILFSIKVSVTAEYVDSFSLDVQWLFIKLHIFPQTEEQKAKREAKKAKKEEKKKKKKKPEEEKKEEDKPSEPKKNIFKEFYENQGFGATVELIQTAAAQLGGVNMQEAQSKLCEAIDAKYPRTDGEEQDSIS